MPKPLIGKVREILEDRVRRKTKVWNSSLKFSEEFGDCVVLSLLETTTVRSSTEAAPFFLTHSFNLFS